MDGHFSHECKTDRSRIVARAIWVVLKLSSAKSKTLSICSGPELTGCNFARR
jgi:hypothetical protein